MDIGKTRKLMLEHFYVFCGCGQGLIYKQLPRHFEICPLLSKAPKPEPAVPKERVKAVIGRRLYES